MKIKVGQLKQIIREEVARLAEGMGHKAGDFVSFLDNSKKRHVAKVKSATDDMLELVTADGYNQKVFADQMGMRDVKAATPAEVEQFSSAPPPSPHDDEETGFYSRRTHGS